ncbi:MAG: hypothetical protein U0Q16_04270 [Bryobacteraceae bacterium]
MDERRREQQLLGTFAAPAKRERYIELLGSPKGRKKVLNALDHFGDLDPSRCHRISPDLQTPEQIASLLRQLAAPNTCYIFSSNTGLDGEILDLDSALTEIVGGGYGVEARGVPVIRGDNASPTK